MTLLGTLFQSLFAGVAAWLSQYVTRKVAFGLTGIATMSAWTLGLYVLMRATLAALDSQAVNLPEFWLMILGISIPPAAPFCFSSYITIWTACTVYTWQRDLLHIALKA